MGNPSHIIATPKPNRFAGLPTGNLAANRHFSRDQRDLDAIVDGESERTIIESPNRGAFPQQGVSTMRSAHSTGGSSDLATVSRVVHRHNWRDLSEWVATFEDLADLSDEQIERLVANPTVS